MNIVCLDLEGVLVPEIWIAFAEASGIPALRRTTRDEPDYDKLMRWRLEILKEHGLGLKEIQSVIGQIDPLPGAKAFLDALRERTQVLILSDTFEEFAKPLMRKLCWPTIRCNSLEVSPEGTITGFRMRCEQSKLTTVKALQSIGYDTIASGDSYNDLGMIRAGKTGFLFRSTEQIKADNPDIPAYETYEELLTAGNTFREVLGEEYYPLAMDAAARMNLMVSYLESTTGKAWVVDRQLQYSADEIKTGLEFLQALEENHVMPTLAAQQTNGTLDQTPMWQNGQYAGTFAWDADAETYRSALKNASGFLVGDEIAFGGQANGGFSKVYLALAINSSCQHPKEAAILVNFLLNEDMGASIMGTACGLPDSVTG